MAITVHSMELIARANQRGRAASLGYPDLLLDRKQMAHYIGADAKRIPARDDSAKIAQWHSVNLEEICESRAFFAALGLELSVFDIKPIRGDEIFIDLNEPLWPQYRQKFNLVIDPGTCEHCFHIGQAAMGVADMCMQGGYIVQGLPLNAYNHGFYCVSPTWVKDFYEDNGFEVEACFGVNRAGRFAVDFRKRTMNYPENSFILVLVRRAEARKLKVPTQWKYR